MNFEFANKELIKLYTTGKSNKYRIPADIIDKFFARIQQIEAANTIFDLTKNNSLNFEKLKGHNNRFSMRINLKYRLEMEIHWINQEKTIGDFIISDISNHYD